MGFQRRDYLFNVTRPLLAVQSEDGWDSIGGSVYSHSVIHSANLLNFEVIKVQYFRVH